MDFPFTHEVAVDGVTVAYYEGTAVIEADADGTEPGSDLPAWTVDEIVLEGLVTEGNGVRRSQVTVPDASPLHDVLLLAILSRHRVEIDERWAVWMRDAVNTARGRFRVAPRLTVAAANDRQSTVAR